MARRYVSPNHQAVPDGPEALAEYLASDRGMRELYGPGGAVQNQVAFHRAYAAAVSRRDPDLGAQLRDQLGYLPGLASQAYRPDAPGVKADGLFSSAGQFFAAVGQRRRNPGNALTAKLDRLRTIQASFGSEVPDAGGFLIPETWRSEVVALALEESIVRPRATVIPMESLRAIVPITDATSDVTSVYGGLSAAWTEEAAALSESQASFGRVVLDAKALKAYFNAPNELIQDSPAFGQFCEVVVPQAVSWYEDVAFLTGTGAAEPQGLTNAAALIQVAKESGQAAATIVWENVVKVFGRMLPSSLNRAVWLASPDTYAQLATMAQAVGTGGGPVWMADGTMSILSRPVFYHQALPVLGSVGDLIFADLSAYVVGDRALMQVDSSPHAKFNLDMTSFRVRHRVDGRPALQSAVTARNNASTTLSAYVAIAAR
jgi:HK97 family phage major capsid protein